MEKETDRLNGMVYEVEVKQTNVNIALVVQAVQVLFFSFNVGTPLGRILSLFIVYTFYIFTL